MLKPIKIVIVDDHPFFRQGVKFYLGSLEEFQLVGEASSGKEALELIATVDVDMILMDLNMPKMDGISTTEALIAIKPSLRILILTSFGEGEKIQSALRAGAAGYCLKDAPPEELASAIKAVAEGGTYLGRGISFDVFSKIPNQKSRSSTTTIERITETLTQRETDVLKLIAQGLSNKEIADQLFVGEKTVKTHVANLLQKLGVKTRTQAALLANKELREDL